MTRLNTVTERSNLAMAMDSVKRGPTHIQFFGNHAVLVDMHRLMAMTPEQLADLQDLCRAKMGLRSRLQSCSPQTQASPA